jgi:mono/diheme cytochrome c family protein
MGSHDGISAEVTRVNRSFCETAVCRLLLAASFCLAVTAAVSAHSLRRANQAKAAESAVGHAAAIARGKAIYAQRCAICHYPDSTAQKIGPGLKNLYGRGKFANGRKVDDDAVARWIESGGKNMPGFKAAIKLEQVRDLIAYLKTL